MPAWHPDFRNAARLPDTKVVRTAFFINGVAVVVALVMGGWCAYQAYALHDLRRQIAQAEERIAHDRKPSDLAIALYKKFQVEAARIAEIDAFVSSRPLPSALIRRLAQTLPADVALDGFELRETGLRLSVSMRGAPDRASGRASDYVEQLRGDAELAAEFGDIALTSLARNAQTGRLTAEIALAPKVKTPPPAGRKS